MEKILEKLKREAVDLWKMAVIIRWGNVCGCAGCKNPVAEIHHYIYRSQSGKFNLEVWNGVPICQSHHGQLHNGWKCHEVKNLICLARGQEWMDLIERKLRENGRAIKDAKFYEEKIENLQNIINLSGEII